MCEPSFGAVKDKFDFIHPDLPTSVAARYQARTASNVEKDYIHKVTVFLYDSLHREYHKTYGPST